MKKLQEEYFSCDCFTSEHTVRFAYDPDDGDLFMSVFLWHWSFWKRVWIAIKYVFGYKSRYGDFDSGTIFQEEDLNRLIRLAQKAKMRKKEITKGNKLFREYLQIKHEIKAERRALSEDPSKSFTHKNPPPKTKPPKPS